MQNSLMYVCTCVVNWWFVCLFKSRTFVVAGNDIHGLSWSKLILCMKILISLVATSCVCAHKAVWSRVARIKISS